MTPFCCNITIQAVVLTKSDVQNGNKTNIINKLLYLNGRLAKR